MTPFSKPGSDNAFCKMEDNALGSIRCSVYLVGFFITFASPTSAGRHLWITCMSSVGPSVCPPNLQRIQGNEYTSIHIIMTYVLLLNLFLYVNHSNGVVVNVTSTSKVLMCNCTTSKLFGVFFLFCLFFFKFVNILNQDSLTNGPFLLRIHITFILMTPMLLMKMNT